MSHADLLVLIACAESPPERLSTPQLAWFADQAGQILNSAQNEETRQSFQAMKTEAEAELKRRGKPPGNHQTPNPVMP